MPNLDSSKVEADKFSNDWCKGWGDLNAISGRELLITTFRLRSNQWCFDSVWHKLSGNTNSPPPTQLNVEVEEMGVVLKALGLNSSSVPLLFVVDFAERAEYVCPLDSHDAYSIVRSISCSVNDGRTLREAAMSFQVQPTRVEVKSIFFNKDVIQRYQPRDCKINLSTASNCKVLILCAIEEESNALAKVFERYTKREWEVRVELLPMVRTLTLTDFGGRQLDVILATSPKAGAPAGNHAAQLLKDHKPKYLIMSGVCAGRAGEIDLGGVIVANKVFALTGKDHTNGMLYEIDANGTDTDLIGVAQIETGCDESRRKFAKYITVDRPPSLGESRKPKAVLGPIAVSSTVVAKLSQETWKDLAKETAQRGLIGLEMEGASLYTANEYYNQYLGHGESRCLVLLVKGVMDFAGPTKGDSCKEYAASAAAAWVLNFLVKYAAVFGTKQRGSV